MLPAIGSLSALNLGGRLGVVVDARPLAEPREGRQLVALQLKTVDQRDAQGQAASRVSGIAPLPAEASEKPAASRRALAMREERGGRAAARLPEELSAAEREVVERLRQRDAQVRQEETAHAAVAGDLAGPIDYVYQRGPDGRPYAVGGSVGIRAALTSGDPAAAQRVGARLAAAAQAATNPSAQDQPTARLGLRLYAEAAGKPPEAPRVDLIS
jgi:hypothetical protein